MNAGDRAAAAPPPRDTPVGSQVNLGPRLVPFDGSDKRLGRLTESQHLLGKPDELRAALDERGYLFIRGLHDREQVLGAGRYLLEHLHSLGKLDPSKPMQEVGGRPLEQPWVRGKTFTASGSSPHPPAQPPAAPLPLPTQ